MNLCRFAISAALSILLMSMLLGCKSMKAPGKDAAKDGTKDAAAAPADPKAKKDGKEQTPVPPANEAGKPPTPGAADSSPIDVAFLLSMSYAEAKTLSANFLEIPPFYKIAADEIEITKKNEDGTPRRVRAKGRVFIEMSYLEPAKALCQELLLSSEELILRGKPVLQRGNSTVEGIDDYTIFYMFGTRLRVIGPHRLTNPDRLASSVDASGLPTLGAWSSAPNPLLPPLTEGAVPNMIRLEAQQASEAEALHQKARSDFGPAQLDGPAMPPESPKKDTPAKKETPPPTTSTEKAKSTPAEPKTTSEPKKTDLPKKAPEAPKLPEVPKKAPDAPKVPEVSKKAPDAPKVPEKPQN